MSRSRLWILGAPDPEMEAIERLLTAAGEAVLYATADGRRVHPGSAYRADPVDFGGADSVPALVYLVECEPSMVLDSSPVDGPKDIRTVTIDHHRLGDPGYGRPPEEFLEASSIGQVVSELARLGVLRRIVTRHENEIGMTDHDRYFGGWLWSINRSVPSGTGGAGQIERGVSFVRDCYVVSVGGGSFYTVPPARYKTVLGTHDNVAIIPHDIVLCAAADHCLGAAYRGECPGVDPDELMAWRAESRAAFQGRSVARLRAGIDSAQEALAEAPILTLASGVSVFDMRGRFVPELPEAAMRAGVSYLAGPMATPDGRRKIVCSGRPEHVRAFLDHWAPAQSLVDTYGDPARGFAGGYLA